LTLAGFGATAFGVAPMAPDAALLPKRVVSEFVRPEPLQPQLDVLAEGSMRLYRSETTRASDTADSLLMRLNVADPAAAAFLRSDPTARHLLGGRTGKMVTVQTDERGALTELVARYAAERDDQVNTHFMRLTVRRDGTGWRTQLESAPMAVQPRIGSGTIRTSLFAATDEAGLPDRIASALAEVFATDLDFHRQLHKGDGFSVMYETWTADGQAITWSTGATARVLAAQFVHDGQTYSALWYPDAAGTGSYYSFDGVSKKRAFLTSPLEFSRVTSGFAMRMHPILNRWKEHKGVDYGAPAGTPIRTVGGGVVDFAGWQNGYGNVVEVRHSPQRTTLYAHLSRIDVRRGERVEQGQRLGAVGSTGWATGPHLHFELKLAGIQQDPSTLALAAEANVLPAPAKASLTALADRLRGPLTMPARNAPPGDAVE